MKPLVTTLLVLLCIGGTAGWLLYEPFDPDRLYEPIPPYATYVSIHEGVADRWEEWTQNPVVQSLLINAGLEVSDIDTAREDPGVQFMVDTLADRKTLLAYMPSLGESGKPGWSITSHLGGRGIWLRWMLRLFPQENLIHLGSVRGVDMWMVEADDSIPERMYFSIPRNMMVGCYAGDPSGLRILLNLLDFENTYWRDQRPEQPLAQGCLTAKAPDRGWMEIQLGGELQSLEFAFKDVTEDTLEGRFCGEWPLPVHAEVESSMITNAWSRFAFPDSLVWSLSALDAVLPLAERVVTLTPEVLGVASNTPAFLGIQYGDFSGKLLGMNVPSSLLAIPVEQEGEAYRVVNRILDALNREKRWGLVTRISVQRGYALTLIDASIRSPYSVLSDKDKVACLHRDGWLLIGSHARALSEIAAWMDSGVGSQRPAFAEDPISGQSHVWLDVDVIRKTLPPLLQMYNFKLLLDRGPESKAKRDMLASVSSWLNAFEPFEQGRISLYSSGDKTIIDFDIKGEEP